MQQKLHNSPLLKREEFYMISTNNYLVVTPNNYYLCNDVRHIINTIKHSCYRLNTPQLQSFNSCIRTHIKNDKFRQPIKKGGTRNKFIIKDDIYVVKLDKEEIRMFY